MGVTKQQVSKARQLQGQNRDVKLIAEINKFRDNIICYIVGKINQKQKEKEKEKWKWKWEGVIGNIIDGLNNCTSSNSNNNNDDTIINGMTISILQKLSQKQPNKFYAPSVITFMLTCFQKYKPTTSQPQHSSSSPSSQYTTKICYNICHFFTQICKKCNSNIFPYNKLQNIANCLIYIIETGKHQLHIFQAFLSLINLSNRNIEIPLSIIQIGLLEQNQYIVHGSLELFNNLLVNTDFNSKYKNNNKDKDNKQTNKYWHKLQKLQQIVYKYYKYYKQMISTQLKLKNTQQINTNNYSHPYKIYCTLLSVLMILKSINQSKIQLQNIINPNKIKSITNTNNNNNNKYTIQQFTNWKQVDKILKQIDKNNGDITILLFKLVLHHVDNKTLPSNWNKGYQIVLQKLKNIDIQKWGKINKYVK